MNHFKFLTMQAHEIYTAEYSNIQKCYHIDTLDRTIANNLVAISRNIDNGYKIIGLFRTYDTALKFIERHRKEAVMNRVKAIVEPKTGEAF